MTNAHLQDGATPVKLAPPGAGLPLPELWVARLLTAWQARRTTRERSAARLADEKGVILALARELTPAQAARRVLIKRPRGLEDSSRCWSVWMTMDHLRIVNGGTAELIELLAQGRMPSRVTGTADVKPEPAVDGTVVAGFADACARLESVAASIGDLDTPTRWPHPWFGPLNAARWHFFTAFHMGLHRRQIELITAGL